MNFRRIIFGIFGNLLILLSINFASSYFIRGDIDDIKPQINDKNSEEQIILEKLILAVEKYSHIPYRYGGRSEKGVDCSGFVCLVFKNFFNMNLPQGSRNQIHLGKDIPEVDLKAGDLLFFRMGRNIGHVGIYLSNGYFVSAESHKNKIGISHLDSEYWRKRYVSARRLTIDTEYSAQTGTK